MFILGLRNNFILDCLSFYPSQLILTLQKLRIAFVSALIETIAVFWFFRGFRFFFYFSGGFDFLSLRFTSIDFDSGLIYIGRLYGV